MRKAIIYPIILVLIALLLPACQRQERGLTVVGSTSVEPFAEVLAEEYMAQHGGKKIFIQGGGSSAGIQAVRTGSAMIGMSSRGLNPPEKAELKWMPIAFDAIAVIVHPRNHLLNLSIDQIRKIFSGEITRWKELGGLDRPVTLFTREEGSGTREAFQNLVMKKKEISLASLVQDSNGAIRQVVADDPNAIGYISLGLVNKRVKALQVDGVDANLENISRMKYQIIRPFLFVYKNELEGLAKEFLDYVLSPPAQKILANEGLVSVTAVPELRKEAGR